MNIEDIAIDSIVNGFEDELEKVGFEVPGIRNLLRASLRKAPKAALVGGGLAGTAAIGYKAGEESAEEKIPTAFSIGAQVGAEAQAEHDIDIINHLQAQLAAAGK